MLLQLRSSAQEAQVLAAYLRPFSCDLPEISELKRVHHLQLTPSQLQLQLLFRLIRSSMGRNPFRARFILLSDRKLAQTYWGL
ncbi:hypothetical protein AALP_AA7G263900 [Arabis alpina]|uniref:Uncharacterized protein n=1 Tax=Arabis alpina TaxID=50452 RepID=A0A087GKQ7_ARAAL|nr:hypothetical protein AALP_AA7G263900 [Arabis alpina]